MSWVHVPEGSERLAGQMLCLRLGEGLVRSAQFLTKPESPSKWSSLCTCVMG